MNGFLIMGAVSFGIILISPFVAYGLACYVKWMLDMDKEVEE